MIRDRWIFIFLVMLGLPLYIGRRSSALYFFFQASMRKEKRKKEGDDVGAMDGRFRSSQQTANSKSGKRERWRWTIELDRSG